MTPLSVLDLAPIVEGGTAAGAFRHSLDLAQHAERWGYRRYWLAEHHNMPGIGSAATAVLIGHIGAGTATIRIGAGGIMLPNHAAAVALRPPDPSRVSFVGAPDTIRNQIEEFVAATQADELIVVAHIYDHAARLRSYELTSNLGS